MKESLIILLPINQSDRFDVERIQAQTFKSVTDIRNEFDGDVLIYDLDAFMDECNDTDDDYTGINLDNHWVGYVTLEKEQPTSNINNTTPTQLQFEFPRKEDEPTINKLNKKKMKKKEIFAEFENRLIESASGETVKVVDLTRKDFKKELTSPHGVQPQDLKKKPKAILIELEDRGYNVELLPLNMSMDEMQIRVVVKK